MQILKVTLILLISLKAYSDNRNTVALFFQSAERQMETDSQCEEIKIALNDMLTLPKKEILKKKYKDYQGLENQWSLFQILKRYYVSTNSRNLSEKQFLKDLKKTNAQNAIKKAIEDIGNCDSGIK